MNLRKFFSLLKRQQNLKKENWYYDVCDNTRKDKWEAQTAPITVELRQAVNHLRFETAFRLLENGADPNAPVYVAWYETIDNGMAPSYYREDIVHILDSVKDKAMIKLLRSYGAKTSKDMATEEREKKKKEEEHAQLEHDIQAEALVDSLLRKQTQSVCFG